MRAAVSEQTGEVAVSKISQPGARLQTRGEELANSLSHGIGLAAALVGAGSLIAKALQRGGLSFAIGAAVFGGTMVLVYLASTLYHALSNSRAERVLIACDHIAIFLFIAGTYTPFTLGVLKGLWGWTLLGLVWGLALAGVVLKVVAGARRFPRLSTGLYLGMGWIFLVAVEPLWLKIPLPGLLWLLAGGLAYTVGVAFFLAERLRYSHFVWHLFVLTGTACHFVAVWQYSS
jgi:hemolysin III